MTLLIYTVSSFIEEVLESGLYRQKKKTFCIIWVLPVIPKIPEISGGIQMERSVSVSFDRSIRDHLWRWSTYFGRNIPTEIRRSIFEKTGSLP